MLGQWYFAREGKKNGPFSLEQMQQLMGAGMLQPSDMVLEEGTAKWVAASSITGLFTVPAGVPLVGVPVTTPVATDVLVATVAEGNGEQVSPAIAEASLAVPASEPGQRAISFRDVFLLGVLGFSIIAGLLAMSDSVAFVRVIIIIGTAVGFGWYFGRTLTSWLTKESPAGAKNLFFTGAVTLGLVAIFFFGFMLWFWTATLLPWLGGTVFVVILVGVIGSAVVHWDALRMKVGHPSLAKITLLPFVYLPRYFVNRGAKRAYSEQAQTPVVPVTSWIGISALLIVSGVIWIGGMEYKRILDDVTRRSEKILENLKSQNQSLDADDQAKKDVGRQLEMWIEAMKGGSTGETYWAGTTYDRLLSVRAGTVLNIEVRGEKSLAKVRIDSSNQLGSQITVTWDVSLVKTSGRWLITKLSNADKPEKNDIVNPQKPGGNGNALPKYTRAEFSKLVTGKTKDEVLRLLGRPDRTAAYGNDTEYWSYDQRTYDPVSTKTDFSAGLVIKNGTVVSVNY